MYKIEIKALHKQNDAFQEVVQSASKRINLLLLKKHIVYHTSLTGGNFDE